MISQIRTAVTALACLAWIAVPLTGNAQRGQPILSPRARVLDVLFQIPRRQYLLNFVLRFDDDDTQVSVLVYPDHERYWLRRCEVTTYDLDDGTKRELFESLSKLPTEASDEAVRAIASRLRVRVNHFAIAPEALDAPLRDLKSIQISPALEARIGVDQYSEYEFWYDTGQESVHYLIAGPPGNAAQDKLIRWMLKFQANVPELLKKSSAKP